MHLGEISHKLLGYFIKKYYGSKLYNITLSGRLGLNEAPQSFKDIEGPLLEKIAKDDSNFEPIFKNLTID